MAEIERFCVRCKTRIPEKRVARGSCFCSGECRRQDKMSGVGQRPRSTAACATSHFHTEGRLRVPPDCLPLKLRPVRRAHNLTVVLLPESIVKKRTHKMDSKLANSFSYLELASCDRGFGGYRL